MALGHFMPSRLLASVDGQLPVDTVLQGRLTRLGCCCRLCFVSGFLFFELPVRRRLGDYICEKLEIVNASNGSGSERSALQ